MNYKVIEPKNLSENVFDLVGSKWMLITAVKDGKANTMTASWGGMGIMWNKPISFCVVRPVRYTYDFIEASDYYTLSFFPEEYRPALNLLGTKSGRDGDKISESKLTLFDTDNNTVSFEEANIIMVCRKLYYQDILPETFVDASLDKTYYPQKDYHRMYFSEIAKCMIKE